jgi:hypothetical protein
VLVLTHVCRILQRSEAPTPPGAVKQNVSPPDRPHESWRRTGLLSHGLALFDDRHGLTPPPHGEWRPPASALGRDAERSAGRVVVEVIDTSNHFTELATETTATDCKRGFDV